MYKFANPFTIGLPSITIQFFYVQIQTVHEN